MLQEIFENNKIQILYDPDTEEISFGIHPEAFTTFERLVLARAFDLTDEEEEDE